VTEVCLAGRGALFCLNPVTSDFRSVLGYGNFKTGQVTFPDGQKGNVKATQTAAVAAPTATPLGSSNTKAASPGPNQTQSTSGAIKWDVNVCLGIVALIVGFIL
jgi:hypothetical protein